MKNISKIVIGYGNLMRSDDGVGQIIADVVANWNLPHARSLSVHQLTPELAETISTFDTAIFVDACCLPQIQSVQIERIVPQASEEIMGHSCQPQYLLALSQLLYHRSPKAWWVKVPVSDMGLGERLSPIAKQGIAQALKQIRELLCTKSA